MENGGIVVDDPTELPAGTELYVVPSRGGDDLDEQEPAALRAAIEEAEGELDAGQVVSQTELWARLRAIP